ncbi:MAG: transglycosylase domain-containing protein, partial [Saprospiraceae bacterium]
MLEDNHSIPETKPFARFNKWLRILAGSFVAFLMVIFIAISFSDLPTFDELENPKYDLASIIYDAKGVPFGRYYIEDRVAIEYKQLSEHVKTALLVTEDDRFYSHSGIDLRALFRV